MLDSQPELLRFLKREADEKRKQKAADYKRDIAAFEADHQNDLAFAERMRNMPLHELLGRPLPGFEAPK